jgi:hypothetical protein
MKILEQGAPSVNCATIVYQNDNVILVELDMNSKYTKLTCYSGNQFYIGADENSLHLADGYGIGAETVVELDEIPDDFAVFSTQSSRYTISITFLKRK